MWKCMTKQGAGLGNAFLSHIRAVDGIVHVMRAFEGGSSKLYSYQIESCVSHYDLHAHTHVYMGGIVDVMHACAGVSPE